MPSRGDAGGAVYVEPDIMVANQLRCASVEADTDAQRAVLRPGVVCQGTCGLGGGSYRLWSGGESREEGVALGIHLDAAMRRKGVSKQHLMLTQSQRIVWPEPLEQFGATLDVGE